MHRAASTATARAIGPDRWHFQHGPIDLILLAQGRPQACVHAVQACWHEFQTLLNDLVRELPWLRRSGVAAQHLHHPVAQLMAKACEPYWREDGAFMTPMAAVAGSVAQHLLRHFQIPGVRRAAINNGGDIALHLTRGERFVAGVVGDLTDPRIDATICIESHHTSRGVATSGWSGRSFSMGIADSVTVLAASASQADAAATMIANAVNCNHPAIVRRPANTLRDDSDLGDQLVTQAVGMLPKDSVVQALDAGLALANKLLQRGLIDQATLKCKGYRVSTS
jgi:uncharacterized protein